jgi:phosphoglycolate phosphatase-like HAD superfamily hydrolase
MPLLHFGSVPFAARLVVFDKDGTLIDFHHLWAQKTVHAVERLVEAVRGGAGLRDELYFSLGYDPQRHRFASQSPVVTAAMPTLHIIAASVLYRHGWGWLDAELLADAHFLAAMNGVFAPDMVRSTADLPALFATLSARGVAIAVVTSDDHSPTAATLEILGVARYVDFFAGADDPYPHKPDPAALFAACAQVGVAPAETVMVGDSTTDLLMAQRAGVGLRVAVLTGMMAQEVLAPHADVVLSSVGDISVE